MLIRSVLGNITFSKAVVSKIISKTVIATAGVAAMSTGLIKGLAQKVTGNSLMSGIELTTDDTGLNISLSITVHYGVRMQEVCKELQQNIRASLEKFTGLPIDVIHVKVEGIALSGN
ncbi:hypothetical protein GCM10010912_57600 [Paenibacillus albidus]|uniref:Asp23/Gls24 family envelope stress response protein n=1 Tax=Paenibacillus albidus TaxID=2041023 RepID=A0A917FV28_9BACL|nr:Asp23/Gls24 family envelope stress response protein [Paenibacillus albidus]GGG05397.1 hypothetical protein GCM10010912_57600 [Paenibacillus albidus]